MRPSRRFHLFFSFLIGQIAQSCSSAARFVRKRKTRFFLFLFFSFLVFFGDFVDMKHCNVSTAFYFREIKRQKKVLRHVDYFFVNLSNVKLPQSKTGWLAGWLTSVERYVWCERSFNLRKVLRTSSPAIHVTVPRSVQRSRLRER